MLLPFYKLEGRIDLIKVTYPPEGPMIDKWYEDENGNRAIVTMKDLKDKKIIL